MPASNFKYERVFTLFHVLQTNCQATERLLKPALKYQFAQVSQTSPVFPSEADEIIVMIGVGSAVNEFTFSVPDIPYEAFPHYRSHSSGSGAFFNHTKTNSKAHVLQMMPKEHSEEARSSQHLD